MTGIRIDKWLWAARFYKTRALASKACELGRVLYYEQRAKPAREVHPGDKLCITTDSGGFEVEVVALSEIRGPATVAQTLYRESEASREARLKQADQRRANRDFNAAPRTRPSKKDRRRIIQFRGDRS
jgi:ribosome-associated heat shock protein Hsp15